MKTKKTKIAFVIQPIDGGSALHVRQLLSSLDRARYQLLLIAPPVAEYIDCAKNNGVEFHALNVSRSANPIKDIAPTLQLRAILKKTKPHIVHLHSTKAGLLGRIASFGLPIKVIYTPHSPLYLQPMSRLKRTVFYWSERATMPLVDKLILVSKSEQQVVVSDKVVSEHKTIVIPNGLALPQLAKKQADKSIVIMVSRLEKQKRQQDLINAAPSIIKALPQVQIWLVGEGSRHQELSDSIAALSVNQAVKLLGHRNDVQQLLQQSSVLVQCSETEGMPYTVLEGMSFGLPVVATDVEGNKDLVEHQQTGYLYQKADHEQLARYIIALLQNSKLARQYGMLGRQRVQDSYSLDHMIALLDRVYAEKV